MSAYVVSGTSSPSAQQMVHEGRGEGQNKAVCLLCASAGGNLGGSRGRTENVPLCTVVREFLGAFAAMQRSLPRQLRCCRFYITFLRVIAVLH